MQHAALVAPARTRTGYLLQLLGFTLLVLLAMWMRTALESLHGLLPPLSPGTGVAFAGLLLLGLRALPAVFVASLITNVQIPNVSATAALGFAFCATATAGVPAALCLRGRGGAFSLESVRDVGGLLGFGIGLGTVIGAGVSLGVAQLWAVADAVAPAQYVSAMGLGIATGFLVLGAPLYAWLGPPSQRPRGSWVEALFLAASFAAALALTGLVAPLFQLLSFPLIAWAALRFGARGTTLALLATYAMSVAGFTESSRYLSGIMLQLFYALLLLAAGATGLILAASAVERDQARTGAHVADDNYRALLTSAPLAMVGLDPEGRVTLWNESAERLFGWAADEVLGKPLPTVPADRMEEFTRGLGPGAMGAQGRETERLRRDGARLDVIRHAWPLYDANGQVSGSLAALQDITGRKQAERLQAAVYRVAQAALTAKDLEALYAAIHGIVAGLMPARSFFIATYEAATDTLSFPYWVDERDPRPAPRQAGKGLVEYVLRTGRPLRDRPATIGSLVARGEVDSFGATAEDWLGVPLVVDGESIGVLAVQSYDRGVRYTEREEQILEFVSAQVAMAIQRRRAEAARRAAAEELEALFAAMTDVIVVFNQDGVFLKVAPTKREYHVRPEHEVLGKRLDEVLPADLAERAGRAIRTALAERRSVTFEYELAIQGAAHWFSGTASPLGPDRVVWVARDITPIKESQRLEQAVGAVARAALEGGSLHDVFTVLHRTVGEFMPAPNCYVALREDGRITFPYWVDQHEAPQVARDFGRSFTDWVLRHGRPLRYQESRRTGVPPASEATLIGVEPADWMAAPLTVGDRAIGVLAVQTYDPGARYTERDERLLQLLAGQVAFAIERKRAEDAIRQSEERFRVLATTSSDIIYEWEPDAGREWWSENITEILGYQPLEIQFSRDDWRHLLHPDEAERVRASWEGAMRGGAILWREEYRIRRKNGSYAWVLERARLEHSSDGRVLRVIGAMLDITGLREAREALRRSEDQLRQAAKMEAVGRLAGGVAHDFNNLLTSVLGHADLALGQLPPGDPLQDDLQEIKAAGTRAAALTQQLLAFSRKQVLEPRVLDLNTVVAGITKMLRRTIGEDVTLVTRLAPDLGQVRADPVQMEQVLLNLAVNARDAMPEGGRLTIETANVMLPGGPGVRIRVEDSGVGMTEEVRVHLFEPFFTTKEVGKGTGLGLATAYGIVQQSGGTIAVSSTPGEGTTFLIDLPQVRAEDPPLATPALRVSAHGSETILLVEDEEAVRNLTRRVLEQHGYTVLSAPHGEAALELARQHPERIHLLLTDVVMPGISGPRLAEELLAARPGVQCLFMSGYAATALGPNSVIHAEGRFLQKPFTTSQLLQRLRELLASVN